MLRLGMACAFTLYSQNCIVQEVMARTERPGVHAHGCVPTWGWRAGRRNLEVACRSAAAGVFATKDFAAAGAMGPAIGRPSTPWLSEKDDIAPRC